MIQRTITLMFAFALLFPVIASTGCDDPPQANRIERPEIERDLTERPPEEIATAGLIDD